MVSNNRNKIHQTWGPPFSRSLYFVNSCISVQVLAAKKIVVVSPEFIDDCLILDLDSLICCDNGPHPVNNMPKDGI